MNVGAVNKTLGGSSRAARRTQDEHVHVHGEGTQQDAHLGHQVNDS